MYPPLEVTTRTIEPLPLQEGERRRLQQLFLTKTKPQALKRCLAFDAYHSQTVAGHVIPRSWLKGIAEDDGVVAFGSRRLRPNGTSDSDANPAHSTDVRLEAISTATTRHFTCATHEKLFFDADKPEPDTNDLRVLNLMAYRAVISQLWTEIVVHDAEAALLEQYPEDQLASIQAEHRTRTARDLNFYKRQLEQCLRPDLCTKCDGRRCKVIAHIVRHIRGDPTVAVCQFSDGLRSEAIDDAGHRRRLTNWGLTVVPTPTGHTVIFHYFWNDRGLSPLLEDAISKYKSLTGKPLQEFVSIEILDYTEGFAINPQMWAKFGAKRRDAILQRFLSEMPFIGVGTEDEIEKYYAEVMSGTRPRPMNPRQLNLFSH